MRTRNPDLLNFQTGALPITHVQAAVVFSILHRVLLRTLLDKFEGVHSIHVVVQEPVKHFSFCVLPDLRNLLVL